MTVAEWSLLISVVALPTSILTLAVVIRSEVRDRRRWPSVMWSFNHYGTRTFNDGRPEELATELVQFGGAPARVMWYTTVGFEVRQEEGARLRSYVKGEDQLPLHVVSDDPGNAWMLIWHTPRDDSSWIYVRFVPLEPMGDKMHAALDVAWERHLRERRGVRSRAVAIWQTLARRPVIRPVGPGSYSWARLSARQTSEGSVSDIETVLSVATATDPKAVTLRVH